MSRIEINGMRRIETNGMRICIQVDRKPVGITTPVGRSADRSAYRRLNRSDW
jgi:hypothetical protein